MFTAMDVGIESSSRNLSCKWSMVMGSGAIVYNGLMLDSWILIITPCPHW